MAGLMRIGAEQMALFQADAEDEFLDRLVARFTGVDGRWRGSDAVPARPRVARQIADARAAGLTSERDLAGYAEAATWVGEDFATYARLPWATAILGDARDDKGARLLACARIEARASGSAEGDHDG